MAELPAPPEGIVLTHFIVSDDVERSRRFYTEVIGGRVVFPGEPVNVALSNSWIVINAGGGPADDKPTVTLETPRDPDRVSSFLNIRVKDIEAVYAEWSARGAHFLTPPKQHQYEKRCYIRDPDGHLTACGASTSPGTSQKRWGSTCSPRLLLPDYARRQSPHLGRPDSRSPAAMSLAVVASLYPRHAINALEESIVTATYTFDVFSSLDGFGAASGNWTGYWGKQGPELLDHRLDLYKQEQRMVFGASTYRAFARMLASSTGESEVRDPWVIRMRSLPATVVSTTLEGPLDWPDATVVSGDAVDVVARLKEESEVPLRSHGSLSMNRALMAAGLVDRVQVTLFPVITGQTGLDPVFGGAADFDLELIERRTLDGHIQELIYRPALHV